MKVCRRGGAVGTAALVLSLVSGLWRPCAFGQERAAETAPASLAVSEASDTAVEPHRFFDESTAFPLDEDATGDDGSFFSEGTGGGKRGLVDVLQALISLGIVLAGVCLLVWLLKRFVVGTPVLLDKRVGRVVGRIYLSPKNVVYLVHLADRVLVVGASSASLTCLAEIRDQAVVERIVAGTETFADTFDRANRSMAAEGMAVTPPDTLDEHMEDIESQITRLRTLGDHESETQ